MSCEPSRYYDIKQRTDKQREETAVKEKDLWHLDNVQTGRSLKTENTV